MAEQPASQFRRAIRTAMRKTFTESQTWRSSVTFVTFVVAVGLAVDGLNANVVVAVFPFRLEALHYHDVSGLVGWLLFLYSIGLVISTPVIAMVSERLRSRRGTMIAGQLSLLASQLLLMMAPTFWVMCIGRFLEGVSSAVIMTAGLALICDTTPEKDIGAQLGTAMVGMPLGALLGPPVGGALYDRWGYRAPFIFVIFFTALDFACRVLVVEKRVSQIESLGQSQDTCRVTDECEAGLQQSSAEVVDDEKTQSAPPMDLITTEPALQSGQPSTVQEHVSASKILLQFASSPRLLASLVVVFICSFVFAASDVTIPLRLQGVWGFNSRKVGIAYLAAIIPTMISNPLSGMLSDRFGAEWIAIIFTICGTPWWGAMTTTFSLPFFIVSYGIENFFIAAVAPPVTSELAAITRSMKGVGYAHTYGTFNIVMGAANAAGSIVSGQVYGHRINGWDIVCYIHIGMLALALIALISFTGERPLLRRGWKIWQTRSDQNSHIAPASGNINPRIPENLPA